MSSSSSRVRVIRGRSIGTGFSPLDVEIPHPPESVDPAVARAEEQRGYDDGFQAGLAEGLASGRAAAAAESAGATTRVEMLARALVEAAEDLRRRQALELAGLEDALARTAFDLAAAVGGRELQLSRSPGADALARALGLVPAGSAAAARLHPDNARSVGAVSGAVARIAHP